MKKSLWMGFVMLLTLVVTISCSTTGFGLKEKTIGKIAVRKVAFYVGMNNPDLIAPGLGICKEILDTDDESIAREALKVAVNTAMKEIGVTDPFIAQDVTDLMDILDINAKGKIGDFDLTALKFIVVGMQEGLKQARDVKFGTPTDRCV